MKIVAKRNMIEYGQFFFQIVLQIHRKELLYNNFVTFRRFLIIEQEISKFKFYETLLRFCKHIRVLIRAFMATVLKRKGNCSHTNK